MPKDQRAFTKEFKLEAVQLVQKSGKPQAQIARDLGIADSTVASLVQGVREGRRTGLFPAVVMRSSTLPGIIRTTEGEEGTLCRIW
jgi:transposase-like protein